MVIMLPFGLILDYDCVRNEVIIFSMSPFLILASADARIFIVVPLVVCGVPDQKNDNFHVDTRNDTK